MQVLICNSEQSPCPPDAQQWIAVDQAFTPGALGIDAKGVETVYLWAFGVVIFAWLCGYVIGVALKVVRLA